MGKLCGGLFAHFSGNLAKSAENHVLGHGRSVTDSKLGVVNHLRRLLESRWTKDALVREAVRAAKPLAEDEHWPQSHLRVKAQHAQCT